jgi:hypothetical protein
MVTLSAGQVGSLWDEAPVEVRELPEDLAGLDRVLGDPELLPGRNRLFPGEVTMTRSSARPRRWTRSPLAATGSPGRSTVAWNDNKRCDVSHARSSTQDEFSKPRRTNVAIAIVDRPHSRLLAGRTPAIGRMRGLKISDRLVSLADPEARPIRKGKLGRPNEFGYVAQLCELTENTRAGACGFILPAAYAPGNPGENTLLPLTAGELQHAGIKLTRLLALSGRRRSAQTMRSRRNGGRATIANVLCAMPAS